MVATLMKLRPVVDYRNLPPVRAFKSGRIAVLYLVLELVVVHALA